MKKRILSVLLAVIICISLAPVAALAAPAFEDTFFPEGTIAAPEAPYLIHKKSSYGDMLYMWYNPSEELRALNAEREYYPISDVRFEEAYGIYQYTVYMQTDMKVDDGAWQYTADWDQPDGWWEPDVPNSYVFACSSHPNADAQYAKKTLSDLCALGVDGDPGFLAPAVYPFEDEYGNARFGYDLDDHTISVRYRFAVDVSPEYGVHDVVFSDWSPVSSIGKNGTQKPLTAPASLAAPVISDFRLEVDAEDRRTGRYFISIPDSIYNALLYCEADQDAFEPMRLQAQMRVNGGEWENVYTANPCSIEDGYRSAAPENGVLKESDSVEVRVRIESNFLGMVSDWSNVVGTKTEYAASNWAKPWIEQADELGLIPDCLAGQDLKQQITRKEFAAVAVKIYESLTGETTEASMEYAFADCDDPEVLKAVAIGITNGTSLEKNLFSPDEIINREQLATMLTRVYKKVALEGWTLATDKEYTEQFRGMFTMPDAFADDANISGFAKDSVYFMKAQGIIDGVGDNMFAPKHGMSAEEAAGYGLATREQALKIAVGMVTNLG